MATLVTNSLPAHSKSQFRLAYDPTTKKVLSCFVASGITRSSHALFAAETWTEIQTKASELQLIGLPKEAPGEGNQLTSKATVKKPS